MNLSLELFKDIRNSGTVLKSLKKYCRNRPHFISNALKYVGGSGSAPDHAGELTTLPPDPLVGRGFAPSALATRYFLAPNILILCAWFPGLRDLNCMVPPTYFPVIRPLNDTDHFYYPATNEEDRHDDMDHYTN